MRPGGATVALSPDSSSEGCVFKSRPEGCQLFYQFFRVDAFDIILIVISVYARKRSSQGLVAQW